MDLKCFIIDDEPGARFAIRSLIKSFIPELEILGEADGVYSASKQLRDLKPNVVFLDLEMLDSNGFEIFGTTEKPGFEVIVTTAHTDQALEAYKHGVADYLVKPLDPEALKRAVGRVRRILAPLENARMISFQTADGTQIISSNQIIRLEANRNYTNVIGTFGKPICISKNLGHYEPILEKLGFLRVHHSHIVSIYQITKLNRSDGMVEMKDGQLIPISREKKKRLVDMLDQAQIHV